MPSQDNPAAEMKLLFSDEWAKKQRRQMLIALTLLLAALIVVLTKDREFWFPPAPVSQSESEPSQDISVQPDAKSEPAVSTEQLPLSTRSKSKSHMGLAATAKTESAPAVAPLVTSRTVLPPLEVEVVAGDEHRTIQAGANSVNVDLQPRTAITHSTSDPGGVSDATGRVHLSAGAAQIVSRPVEPNYPLLAKQMRVQGAVVLQALIARDGNIQTLQILSGPTILSTAAREAVKQWRFKPYVQSGEAVETEARITVNFTIFTQ
jgi:TonB family protein